MLFPGKAQSKSARFQSHKGRFRFFRKWRSLDSIQSIHAKRDTLVTENKRRISSFPLPFLSLSWTTPQSSNHFLNPSQTHLQCQKEKVTMKPKNLEPIKHSLEVDDRQESCPVTPVNRSFPSILNPSFATAILSPSSNEVFAARTRARSRSEAYLMRNEEECLSALSTVKKPKLMVDVNECASKEKMDESSIEQSMDETDFSMSRMKIETPDTSQESIDNEVKPGIVHRHPQTLRRSTSMLFKEKDEQPLPLNAQRRMQTMRKKSNTISMPAEKAPKFQDVFGPKLTLDDKVNNPNESAYEDRAIKAKPSYPRRMTIGGPASVLRSAFTTVKPSEKLRHKPSLRSVTEGAILENTSELYRTTSQTDKPKTLQKATKRRTESQNSAQSCLSDPNDESSIAFQYLIQGLSKERPSHSAVLSEMEPVADQSLNAVMEYRSTSPTETESKKKAGPPCDLCGAIAVRMTVLEPCQHLACAACCSSGLNQVTATPPRPHVCAACHTPVKGINLRKSSISESSQSNKLSSGSNYMSGSVYHQRPQTPTQEDQGECYPYVQGKVTSSPLTAWSHRLSGTDSYGKGNLEEIQGYSVLRSSTPDQGILSLAGLVASSDSVTDDVSFTYMSSSYHELVRTEAPKTVSPMMLKIPASQNMREGLESNRTSVVVRLDNIPWKLTYNDVLQWLPDKLEKMLPDKDKVAQAVHIPIDIVSGKTANCCFVECRNKTEAMRFVRHRNNSRLLGRPVSLILTTHEDLLNEIFPFRLMSPRKDEEHCIYFTPGILAQIVQLLKLGSAQLKGPVKVVELATSMVRLVPAILNEKLRDLLFERVKEIIVTCIVASSELSGIHESLNRLLLASSTCACFTVTQRIDILDNARRALNAVASHYT